LQAASGDVAPLSPVRSTHERAFSGHSLTLFVLFILPVWLWLHYNNRTSRGELPQSEQQRLVQLTDDARRMRERIQALEDILDAEHPNWRDR
jgi:phage shock protein B